MRYILALLLTLSIGSVYAGKLLLIETAPMPDETATCPVCGMFVAKYPEWIAHVRYEDDHKHYFDGAKDLFKYLENPEKWAGTLKHEKILDIGVTEYYDLQRVNAKEAWYVIGSDVLGPMGHELIPLASENDARDFSKDHSGTKILRFHDINNALLERLDAGKF